MTSIVLPPVRHCGQSDLCQRLPCSPHTAPLKPNLLGCTEQTCQIRSVPVCSRQLAYFGDGNPLAVIARHHRKGRRTAVCCVVLLHNRESHVGGDNARHSPAGSEGVKREII